MTEFLIFCIPTLAYLVVRRRDPGARQTMGLRLPSPSGCLLGLVAAGVSLGIGWLTTLGVDPQVLRGSGTAGQITGVAAGLAVVLRAIGEEVLFRGFLQGVVTKRWGDVVGVPVQGVVFLLPHLLLLTVSTALAPLVAGQFVIGLMLGWLRAHTGSIAPGALAHVVANVAAALAP